MKTLILTFFLIFSAQVIADDFGVLKAEFMAKRAAYHEKKSEIEIANQVNEILNDRVNFINRKKIGNPYIPVQSKESNGTYQPLLEEAPVETPKIIYSQQ